MTRNLATVVYEMDERSKFGVAWGDLMRNIMDQRAAAMRDGEAPSRLHLGEAHAEMLQAFGFIDKIGGMWISWCAGDAVHVERLTH